MQGRDQIFEWIEWDLRAPLWAAWESNWGEMKDGRVWGNIIMYVRREIGIQRRKEGISFMRSSWVEVESPNENGNNEGKYCVSFGHCKRWFCVPLFSFSLFFLSSSLLSFSLFFLSFLVNTSIPLINYRLPLSAPLSLSLSIAPLSPVCPHRYTRQQHL